MASRAPGGTSERGRTRLLSADATGLPPARRAREAGPGAEAEDEIEQCDEELGDKIEQWEDDEMKDMWGSMVRMEDELKVTMATKGAGKDNHKECKDRNMEGHKKGAPGLHEGYESTKNQGEAAVRDDDSPQHSVEATGRDDKGTKHQYEAPRTPTRAPTIKRKDS